MVAGDFLCINGFEYMRLYSAFDGTRSANHVQSNKEGQFCSV